MRKPRSPPDADDRKLRRVPYGRRSERKERLLGQLEFELDKLTASAAAADLTAETTPGHTTKVKAFERRRPSRKLFPEHLPRERVVAAAVSSHGLPSETGHHLSIVLQESVHFQGRTPLAGSHLTLRLRIRRKSAGVWPLVPRYSPEGYGVFVKSQVASEGIRRRNPYNSITSCKRHDAIVLESPQGVGQIRGHDCDRGNAGQTWRAEVGEKISCVVRAENKHAPSVRGETIGIRVAAKVGAESVFGLVRFSYTNYHPSEAVRMVRVLC